MKYRRITRLSTGLLILSLLVTMLPLAALPASAQTSELFFSEYIEGTASSQPLPLVEDFDDCTLAGWQIVSVDTDTANTWSCSASFSNIEANGYGDTAPANEWLITPPLNLDAQDNDTLTFRSQTSYTDVNYPQLHVLYSTDYGGGGDPTTATWTELSGINFSPQGSSSWTDSGTVDLSGINGTNVYIAFQYVSSGTGSGTAARWRLDAINVFETTEPGQPLPLVEDFDDCTLAGWQIVSVDTDTANTWSCSASFSNIEANGYGDTAPANEWLITPPLNLDAQGNDTLTFRSYTRYTDSGISYPQLKVLYSTAYAGGGDPTSATWIELTGITFSPENSGSWVDSGAVDLSGISGTNVYLAFNYVSSGTGSGTAANWRLDAINIFEQAPVSALVINEIDYDQPSTDFAEFIEIRNNDSSAVDLSAFALELVNGTGGGASVYQTITLPSVSLVAGDYFVVCADAATVINCDLDVSPDSNLIQNGAPDAVALVQGTTIIDAVSYEGDTGAPYTEGSGVGLEDSSSAADMGISRCPDGTDTDQNNVDFALTAITPGAANICEACGDPFIPIYDVQGTGDASPLVGTVVSTEGVVTGDFQGSDELAGFFIQDLTGDGEPSTSDGVFVYAPGGADVVVGEHVRVRGTVSEYNGLTEIGYVDLLLSCEGTGTVGAVAVDLPVPVDLEPYEGMLVTFPEALTASQNYFQGRYGQVTLSSEGRLFVPTNVYEPLSSGAIALADENMRRMIVLDDGMDVSDYGDNPAPIPYIGLENTLRAGDTVAGLTGVIDYGQITAPPDPLYHYRLHPTAEPVTFTRLNGRTVAPDGVGGIIKIASFNVLNYFNGDGMGGGFPTSRGASTPYEFERQRNKIIPAIIAMDADVIGLMEIENDGYDPYSAIADLVNGLNNVAGAGTYAFIDPGVAPVGTDEIAVGLIYKPGSVTPVGAAAILDSSVDPTFRSDYNRPAIAQTFDRSMGGGRFTVIVNHLKSKGSPCDDIGDPDIGDGQGNCNLTRKAAAIALTNWLATDPTGSGDPDFFIIGDLNSYAMEDPITALKDAGYSDLVAWAYGGPWTYSYTFDGQAGYLDHSLASPEAALQVFGATIWHINTDEPSVIDYNTEYKPQDLYTPTPYRASDHDPVIVGFCEGVPPELEVKVTPDMLWPPNHKYVKVDAEVTVSDNFDPAPTVTLISVTSDEPDAGLDDEDLPDDIVIKGDFKFRLRAERWDEGDGRTYTITYRVTDACGNWAEASATVTVPHDMGVEGD